jgi:NAD(P)-dependent dehydrogenase (short-subunit alcohol dehydrogenase family)
VLIASLLSAMYPTNWKISQPEEGAELVVWLCPEASSFVAGDAIPVDGGWVAQ